MTHQQGEHARSLPLIYWQNCGELKGVQRSTATKPLIFKKYLRVTFFIYHFIFKAYTQGQPVLCIFRIIFSYIYFFWVFMVSFIRFSVILLAYILGPHVTLYADQIAVFYALEKDLHVLSNECTHQGSAFTIGTRSVHRLTLGKHTIYAVKMGSGSVESATSAQAILARIRCDSAFSVGPAGALSNTLKQDSWHVIECVTAHQLGKLGETGFLPSPKSTMCFEIDHVYTETLIPTNIPFSKIQLVSGELFMSSLSERNTLHLKTKASAIDMNTFGLAVVCADHRVPLVNLRVISDYADENASDMFQAFLKSYSGVGGKIIADLIKKIPPNPAAPKTYSNIQIILETTPAADNR